MYIFLDTETFGLGIDKTLLEVGFVITDENFDILFTNVFKVKPNDGIYHGTPYSLDINKISLIEHDKNAITYKDAGSRLYNNLNIFSNSGKDKLIPIGKNIYFDLQFIWHYLLSRNSWENFCSYRIVDISAIITFLQMQNKIPLLEKTGLSDICNYFNIPFGDELHTSLGDVHLYINLMKRLVQL